MKSLFIESIGLAAPGLAGWKNSQEVLRGQAISAAPLEKYKPQRLPPNERRRVTELVRLAFRVCEEAVDAIDIDESTLAAVFASSDGDNQVINNICRALCQDERAISPTQFHNSVHNSAAGYWSIATKSQAPSTSISDLDTSFSAGLVEAATLALTHQQSVLLATYDSEPPIPLSTKRLVTAPFGCALILSAVSSKNTVARLDIEIHSKTDHTVSSICFSDSLELIRQENPASRTLPLLEMIALNEPSTLVFDMSCGQWLSIAVSF